MAAQVIRMQPRVTTNNTIMADLQHTLTLRQRHCVDCDGTVGGFIRAIRALGITDDMDLGGIEFGQSANGNGQVTAELDAYGLLEIREGRL
jgi:hypothetical protein